MRRYRFSRVLFLLVLLGSVIVVPNIMFALGSAEGDIKVVDTQTISVRLSFDVNRNVSVENNTLQVDLFGLLEEAYTNNSAIFKDNIFDSLNSSLAPQGLEVSQITLRLNSTAKRAYLSYNITGACSIFVMTQSNQTRQFNPATLLFEIVNRNTSLPLNNTYSCNFDWLDIGPTGTITENFTRENTNFTYVFELDDIFYYSPFGTVSMEQWNQTGNVFSANISYTYYEQTNYLLARLSLPENARGAYADGNNIIYSVPAGVQTPYTVYFAAMGLTSIIIGSTLYFFMQEKGENVKKQPFEEKWKKRRRKRRKR
ncbi:MAG: hypothetical protein ACTSW4_06970 [Candidatus Ranarchaeia archaeon]